MIDNKINSLLFTHDCVIVPGLGGFVASQAAANHNAVRHTFIPPTRVIAFNVFLRQNDGLLANFISSEEKISFSESMLIIERYVERCFMEMEAGRKVTVADIGQLYFDNEKNIQFTPDETSLHALDSFGLSSLRAVPVATKTKKENIFFSPLRESANNEKGRKAQVRKKASSVPAGNRFVNIGLVAGVLLWAMFNVYIIAPNNFNLSALNPFENTSSRIRPVPEEDSASHKEAAPAPAPIVPEKENTVTPYVTEEKPAVKSVEENRPEEIIPSVDVKKNTTVKTGNYFTVVGAFNVNSNVEKMLARLRENGYQNPGSIEKENKPTMVFAGQFAQKADALKSLQHLKELGIDAWVFTR